MSNIISLCFDKYFNFNFIIFRSNFFFLTPYHGLQVIADCKFFSGFHTHNTEGDIYAVRINLLLLLNKCFLYDYLGNTICMLYILITNWLIKFLKSQILFFIHWELRQKKKYFIFIILLWSLKLANVLLWGKIEDQLH